MTDKEIEEVLDEFNCVRPEMLNGEAKRLFNAIMKIADERDELKKIEEAHRELNGELRKELQLKDKMIDEMIDEYAFSDGINIRNFCDEQLRKDKCIEGCEKCIKEYFEKKVESEDK